MGHRDKTSVIALDNFIQATRDSGYKGTVDAVCELVDNAIQASAKDCHPSPSRLKRSESGVPKGRGTSSMSRFRFVTWLARKPTVRVLRAADFPVTLLDPAIAVREVAADRSGRSVHGGSAELGRAQALLRVVRHRTEEPSSEDRRHPQPAIRGVARHACVV